MAGAPGYTVDEARADAREWASAIGTMYEGKRGWRVCCAILDERIAELEATVRDCMSFVVVHADRWRRDAARDDFHPTHRELIERMGRLTGDDVLARLEKSAT